MIEGDDLAAFVVRILPEFESTLATHWESWCCDEGVIYPMIDGLRLFIERLWAEADPPYREDVFKRFFWIVDRLISDGHPSVRDCVVLEIVEPAPPVWSNYFGPKAMKFVRSP